MKHLKQFEMFEPHAGEHGSVRFSIDDEEIGWFSSEKELQNLKEKGKISVDDYELWYYEDDLETKKILSKYFDI